MSTDMELFVDLRHGAVFVAVAVAVVIQFLIRAFGGPSKKNVSLSAL